MLPIYEILHDKGIVVDERKPDVIRVAPLPMYNSFEDCWRFVDALSQAVVTVGDGKVSDAEREAREKGPTSP